MDLMDLLKATGGGDSVGQLASAVGLGSGDTSKLVESLAPALMRGLQKNTASDDGIAGSAAADLHALLNYCAAPRPVDCSIHTTATHKG